MTYVEHLSFSYFEKSQKNWVVYEFCFAVDTKMQLIFVFFSHWVQISPCSFKYYANLKGLSHQIRFAWKWWDSLGLGKDMWRWTFKNLFTLPLILYCLLKFLCDPHETLTNLLFLRKSASVATSRLRIFTLLLPFVVGVALDVLGNRKVQLFRHTNTGGFLLCL